MRVRRRAVLVGGAGLLVGAAATEGGNLLAADGPSKTVPPGEDLMQEHGVLKRVLLVYRAAIDRFAAGTAVPTSAVHGGATVVHDYIEGFHEQLEEVHVFPALRRAGVEVQTVDTLTYQHLKGRQITTRLLDATSSTLTPTASRQVASDLAAFVRMYEPHEAREDTVVFPALREVLGAEALQDMGEQFATLERRQLGPTSFRDRVAQVAALEQQLGIADLTQFTPA